MAGPASSPVCLAHLQETLGVPAEIGLPEIALPEGEAYDPVFAVAIGLALREVT